MCIAVPMPWPPYSRDDAVVEPSRRPACSAAVWTAYETSVSRPPARTAAMPAHSASSQAADRARSAGAAVPTASVTAASPCQPSRIAPQSTETGRRRRGPARSTGCRARSARSPTRRSSPGSRGSPGTTAPPPPSRIDLLGQRVELAGADARAGRRATRRPSAGRRAAGGPHRLQLAGVLSSISRPRQRSITARTRSARCTSRPVRHERAARPATPLGDLVDACRRRRRSPVVARSSPAAARSRRGRLLPVRMTSSVSSARPARQQPLDTRRRAPANSTTASSACPLGQHAVQRVRLRDGARGSRRAGSPCSASGSASRARTIRWSPRRAPGRRRPCSAWPPRRAAVPRRRSPGKVPGGDVRNVEFSASSTAWVPLPAPGGRPNRRIRTPEAAGELSDD